MNDLKEGGQFGRGSIELGIGSPSRTSLGTPVGRNMDKQNTCINIAKVSTFNFSLVLKFR